MYVHRYTCRRKNPIKQARLDYIITSKSFVDLITFTRNVPGYKSNRSISEMNILFNKFKRGRGVWNLNCDLLKDIAYVNMINNIIKEEKITYALPIYNIDFVTNPENDNDILFTIGENQFLEILVVKIRGETIKYSSIKKKKLYQERNRTQTRN